MKIGKRKKDIENIMKGRIVVAGKADTVTLGQPVKNTFVNYSTNKFMGSLMPMS
jgi:hypothetical protein